MATGAAVDVVMPQMGVSVSEGTVTKWLKQVGEEVQADEGLPEISTDKVDTEVPSPGSGVVSEILVPEGETVEVGTLLARIGGEAGAAAPPPPEAPPAQTAPAQAVPEQRAPEPAQRAPAQRAPAQRAPEESHVSIWRRILVVLVILGLIGLIAVLVVWGLAR